MAFLEMNILLNLYEEIELLRKLLANKKCISVYINLHSYIRQFNEELSKYPTAKFWLMYIEMVSIVQWYIHSERGGY